MKTKQVLAVMITSLFLLYGCSNNEDSVEESALASKASESKGSSVINQEYPDAKEEVLATFVDIATNITLGAGNGGGEGFPKPNINMDQLISFHAYGPKFVEFNNGLVYDSAGNEHNERQLFGEDLEEDGVVQFAPYGETLKIAVYNGNVANLTFISDFKLKLKAYPDQIITVNNLITLLFVKVKGDWKMVHEHHSPAKL